jgi:hypothetical protein
MQPAFHVILILHLRRHSGSADNKHRHEICVTSAGCVACCAPVPYPRHFLTPYACDTPGMLLCIACKSVSWQEQSDISQKCRALCPVHARETADTRYSIARTALEVLGGTMP